MKKLIQLFKKKKLIQLSTLNIFQLNESYSKKIDMILNKSEIVNFTYNGDQNLMTLFCL